MGLFASWAEAPPAVTYIGNNLVGFATGAHTHSGFAIGTPTPRRAIVAVLNYASGGGSPVTITINGVTAASVVSQYTLQTGMTQIAIARIPTGTTASVTIANTGFDYRSACGVWSISNLISVTPTNTNTKTGTPASLPINVSARGVAIGVLAAQGSVGTASWSVATENFENLYASSSAILSGASLTSPTATTANITSAISGSASGTSISSLVASFR